MFFSVTELVRGLFGNHTTTPLDIDGNLAGSLASQLCPLGPKDRCTPSQAQAMGEQLLSLMATHEANGTALPCKFKEKVFGSRSIIRHNCTL